MALYAISADKTHQPTFHRTSKSLPQGYQIQVAKETEKTGG
jgi:hypothetical protein